MGLPKVTPRQSAAEDIDPVGFEALPAAASVTALAAAKLGVDQFRLQLHPGRKPVHQGQQGLAV